MQNSFSYPAAIPGLADGLLAAWTSGDPERLRRSLETTRGALSARSPRSAQDAELGELLAAIVAELDEALEHRQIIDPTSADLEPYYEILLHARGAQVPCAAIPARV